MRYQIFEKGVLQNIIEADEAFCIAYCAETGCTYAADPLPVPLPEPTTEDDLMALVIDLEYRTTLLELGVN